jgi:iron-sulfur cluster repair protein YtfE (RIC family)
MAAQKTVTLEGILQVIWQLQKQNCTEKDWEQHNKQLIGNLIEEYSEEKAKSLVRSSGVFLEEDLSEDFLASVRSIK